MATASDIVILYNLSVLIFTFMLLLLENCMTYYHVLYLLLYQSISSKPTPSLAQPDAIECNNEHIYTVHI